MKLSVKGLALAVGVIWGGAIFLVGIGNLIGGYGQLFLEVISSIYPGYKATASFGQVIIVTLYALLDGVIGGAVLAWLYNFFAGVGKS